MNVKAYSVHLLTGILFGIGLSLSEMINPVRVIAFLDITGKWDPTLVMVMAGALCVSLPLFHIILSRKKPLLTNSFSLPTKTKLDKPLITGAILFGIGWGLVGFCPGPAIAGLASLSLDVAMFLIAMFAGFLLMHKL